MSALQAADAWQTQHSATVRTSLNCVPTPLSSKNKKKNNNNIEMKKKKFIEMRQVRLKTHKPSPDYQSGRTTYYGGAAGRPSVSRLVSCSFANNLCQIIFSCSTI